MSRGNRWVFGYGSLMWRPGFEFLRKLPGTLHGFHRRLCVYSHQYRGTPETPGLVFGLDRGGSCRGVVFEVAGERWDETLAYLREREQLTQVYFEAVKRVAAPGLKEPVEALTYIVNRGHANYTGDITADHILRFVNQGHGRFGSCRDYVRNTIEQLRELGIVDRRLEELGQILGFVPGVSRSTTTGPTAQSSGHTKVKSLS